MIRAFVFPGQGSQKKGMGGELFDLFPNITEKADKILGYSIKELCLEDKQDVLKLTQYTQPALYTVNALMYYQKIQETGQKPDFVAGHSLGEYNALLASGAFDFETGLELICIRSRLMAKAAGGGMAAVIGLGEEKIQEILDEKGLEAIDVANFNSPSQTIISGMKEDIDRAEKVFQEAGARYIRLNVSGAFHSRYMEPARKEFVQSLELFQFSDPAIPVISNVEARPYTKDKIRQLLADQISHSVKWTESIRYLMGKGVQEFHEIGPGKVLAGLVAQIQKQAEPLVVAEDADSPAVVGGGRISREGAGTKITASSLGSREFKEDYHN